MTHEPTPPTGVRFVNGLTGEETDCMVVYVGDDENGMHQWEIVNPEIDYDPFRGDKITIGVLPPKTGLSFRASMGRSR